MSRGGTSRSNLAGTDALERFYTARFAEVAAAGLRHSRAPADFRVFHMFRGCNDFNAVLSSHALRIGTIRAPAERDFPQQLAGKMPALAVWRAAVRTGTAGILPASFTK